jgi:MYXO-CTERM domain-containing protein
MGAVALGVGASAAWAGTINISGSGTWGSFAGTLTYTHVSGNNGTLDVSLTNTSAPANGGYLTGFVFDIIDGGPGRTASLVSTSKSGFQLLLNESAPPFGTFDTGAALGGSWLGGGNPSGGIPVGGTGLFTFAINAPNAAALTSSSFVGTSAPYRFVVRFRGFANGESDKVPVPGPASAALMGLGMLVATRRRR